MIKRIQKFFEHQLLISKTVTDEGIDHRLKLSCAALMLEMINADHVIHDQELKKFRDLMVNELDIDNKEIDNIIELANEERHSATDYYQFTSLINQHYTQHQKITLVEQLWQLAHADNHIDKFEEHLLRRLANLLHIPHFQFMQAKHKAIEADQ